MIEYLWKLLPDRCEVVGCSRHGIRSNEQRVGGIEVVLRQLAEAITLGGVAAQQGCEGFLQEVVYLVKMSCGVAIPGMHRTRSLLFNFRQRALFFVRTRTIRS